MKPIWIRPIHSALIALGIVELRFGEVVLGLIFLVPTYFSWCLIEHIEHERSKGE